jgi:bacterioferritin
MSAYSSTPRRTPPHPFLSNVVEIRRRARCHIGPNIGDNGGSGAAAADRDAVVRLLNTALATEMLCVLRYRRYTGTKPPALAETLRDQFSKRALEEQGHADRIVARIVELGGEPNPDPPHAVDQGDGGEYPDDDADDENLADMLAEDLIVERIAIDTYREMIRYVGDSDVATRRLFESIVTVEQQHAAGLASLRENIQRQGRATAVANDPGRGAEHAVAPLP